MKQQHKDWVYGRHAVAAVLADDAAGVREVWIETGAGGDSVRRVESTARDAGIAVQRVTKKALEKHLGDVVHQGVAAHYRSSTKRHAPDLGAIVEAAGARLLLLLLDEITDPHNVGACLRTADAAGVHAVIAPRRRSAGLTPAVRKVASGAAERVPFLQVANLARTLSDIAEAGVTIIGADAGAETSLFDADLTGPVALVLGSEGRGLRRLTRERCQRLVSLPMSGSVESLNVSVAAGICLFEAVRQRRVAPR
ncbi:MAG TPA: 23S rRNA (guanosine(2251)-2'-O)-methyltransferase RlmB [Gammaproteobacteria bacterium]|jgi:23S rRNA (guanosine2251-2'-O)-methyltransferase